MNRGVSSAGAVLLFLCVGCTAEPTADRFAGTPEVEGDSVLVFPGGARYAPGLRALHYHDQVPSTDGVPFVVVSGLDEEAEGAADRAVFVLRPDRPRERQTGRSIFAYPSTDSDLIEGDTAAAESRLFVGACAYGGVSGVVQVVTTYDAPEPQEAVIATEVHADSLVDIIDPSSTPTLHDVLAMVELGRCRELPRHGNVAQ